MGDTQSQLTERANGQLIAKWRDQDRRITAYRESEIDDALVHDLIIRRVDLAVCPNRLIPSVLHQWREPRHQEFHDRDVLALFNSFTVGLE